jgi:hypothetical protein
VATNQKYLRENTMRVSASRALLFALLSLAVMPAIAKVTNAWAAGLLDSKNTKPALPQSTPEHVLPTTNR